MKAPRQLRLERALGGALPGGLMLNVAFQTTIENIFEGPWQKPLENVFEGFQQLPKGWKGSREERQDWKGRRGPFLAGLMPITLLSEAIRKHL